MNRTIGKLTISLVTLLFLAACAAVAPAAAPEIPQAYVNPDILVDTAWVADHLEDTNVHLLDVSANLEAFQEGHLPGAIYVDWRADLTNPDDATQGQILTQDQLSAVMSRVGVDNEDTVVFYDGTSNLFAARAYWALKYYQHDDVRVYNGGLVKWQADGQAVVTETTDLTPTEYIAGAADPAIRTTSEYVLEHLDDPSVVTCDTRGPEEYAGTDVRSERGGHIPGAINLEWRHAVNEDGTFKAAPELGTLFATA
ncbi:MAG: hypothetical protein K0U66_00505, partial [Gammaproteobacteria bacterium]|nr:hypothetical protein [Gammaproteobacteria bacterium]